MSIVRNQSRKEHMKSISVFTPCYNEEGNVQELYERVKAVMVSLASYRYEHIFIDNASSDRTLEILKLIARADQNVKVIANTRNFGQVRSPMHAFHQTSGDGLLAWWPTCRTPPR